MNNRYAKNRYANAGPQPTKPNVLAVMQHHIDIAKLERDGKTNRDAYDVLDDVYRASVEARATVERLAEAAEDFLGDATLLSAEGKRLRAALAAFRGEA